MSVSILSGMLNDIDIKNRSDKISALFSESPQLHGATPITASQLQIRGVNPHNIFLNFPQEHCGYSLESPQ